MQTVMRDPDIRRLRALAILDRRIRGASYGELAKEFNMSEKTVGRVLTWAKKANLVVEAEDKILEELVPAAIGTVANLLTPRKDKDGHELPVSDKDAAIALRVLEGALPGFGKKVTANPKAVTSEEDLWSYVDQIRKEMVIDGQATGDSRVIEGQTLPLLPPAAETVAPQGLSAPANGDGGDAAPENSPSGE